MKKKMQRFAALLLAFCLLALGAGLPAYAAAPAGGKTKIKIAFYPLDGFFEYDGNGNECGYGVDYLNELAKYGNIEWEYVPADSWEGIKQMMLSGEVDVRMPVSEPTQPSELYDYTMEPMLTSYHAIMTLKSRTDLYYQDEETIQHLKIAVTDNLFEKTGVEDYLTSLGVMDNMVDYPDYNSCRAALDSGEVDALISNVMDLTDDMKLLDKFSVVDNYITTLKGNPCYKLINSAMTQLKLENPAFQAGLYEQYYPERAQTPYTKAECEYIAATDHLTVAVYPDRKPVSYLDANGNYQGIAIDLANLISKNAGIPFEYVPITTATQEQMLETADLVMPVRENIDPGAYFTTTSFLDGEVLLAVREGTGEPAPGAKIGALTATPGILSQMQQLGDFEIVTYPDNRQALAALQKGEIEAFANAAYVINWILENPRYDNLDALHYQSFPLAYELCGKADNAVLQAILDKAIAAIPAAEHESIVQDGTTLSMDDFTWQDRLYVYRTPLLIAALALVVLVGTALAYNSARNRYVEKIKESSRRQQEANRAKSEFLSRMSHDMRTPLNVIMGMSRLARENENPPDTNACLDKINISGEFLLGLINDVLDMEHIESGKMTLHPVPYSGAEFRRYIEAVIEPLCTQKNICFTYNFIGPEKFVLLQDKLRINQIYFNLLSNAVKFTPEGGSVTFTTHAKTTPRKTMVMDVDIADTGIGMSESFMQHMFEPFVQENREFKSISEGTGLGLAIVKRICDLMDMTITATSSSGKGTTFTLHGEYPLTEAPEATAPQPRPTGGGAAQAGAGGLKDKTYLVCEDHPLNQEIIRRLLEKKGGIVVLEDDGKRGVEAFAHSTPGSFAAVLMDIRMPVMDGLQATRAIRALPRADAATVPIIALTANAYEEDVQKCLAAGMTAHLAKPIDPEKLYAELGKYL